MHSCNDRRDASSLLPRLPVCVAAHDVVLTSILLSTVNQVIVFIVAEYQRGRVIRLTTGKPGTVRWRSWNHVRKEIELSAVIPTSRKVDRFPAFKAAVSLHSGSSFQGHVKVQPSRLVYDRSSTLPRTVLRDNRRKPRQFNFHQCHWQRAREFLRKLWTTGLNSISGIFIDKYLYGWFPHLLWS